MSFTIKTLFINTSTLKGHHTDKPFTMQHADLTRWCNRYNTTDISSYKGKEKTTIYAPRRDNPYHKAKEAIIESCRTRIDNLVRKARPDYKPVEETMNQQGDPIRRHRLQLLLAIANLCDAIVDNKWRNRETAFYHINTHYLAIMRELYGQDTVYIDHENVACTDHFIPENERSFGRRRKAKA